MDANVHVAQIPSAFYCLNTVVFSIRRRLSFTSTSNAIMIRPIETYATKIRALQTTSVYVCVCV